jgi:hypothetical protein
VDDIARLKIITDVHGVKFRVCDALETGSDGEDYQARAEGENWLGARGGGHADRNRECHAMLAAGGW